MLKGFAPVLLVLSVLASPLGGQDAPPYGPLQAEEGSPLYRLFITPSAEIADVVGEGRFRVTSWWDYSNIFEYSLGDSVEQRFDMERLVGSMTLRYGVTPRLEIGGRIRFEHTYGGFLDGFISGFHEMFGLPNGDREFFPEDAFDVFLLEDGGEVRMRIPPRSFQFDEMRLFTKWVAHRSEDGHQALSLRFAASVPGKMEAEEGLEDGVPEQSVNVEGSVLGRSSHGPWHWHGMLALASIRGDPRVTELLHPLGAYFLVGGERQLGDSWSFLAQFLGATPYVKGLGSRELDRPAVNLILGFAGASGGWRWQVSFGEDVPPNSPAVDLTLSMVVSRSW